MDLWTLDAWQLRIGIAALIAYQPLLCLCQSGFPTAHALEFAMLSIDEGCKFSYIENDVPEDSMSHSPLGYIVRLEKIAGYFTQQKEFHQNGEIRLISPITWYAGVDTISLFDPITYVVSETYDTVAEYHPTGIAYCYSREGKLIKRFPSRGLSEADTVQYFYPNGGRLASYALKGFGGKAGTFQSWHSNGSRAIVGTLSAQASPSTDSIGTWSFFNETNILVEELTFSESGTRDGRYTKFYDNGNLYIAGQYKTVSSPVSYTLFNPDTYEEEQRVAAGWKAVKIGLRSTYDESGRLMTQERFP